MITLALFTLYLIPAVVLFGTTALLAGRQRRALLLPVERISWALPGLVYAAISPVMYEVAWYGIFIPRPAKGIENFIVEPLAVALLVWLAFIVRLFVAAHRPSTNRTAAYAWIAASFALAIGVFAGTPGLPE